MTDEAVVEAAALSYTYGRRSALDGVSFTVQRGEIFGLLGPNGSGKTTLFRILSTLLVPGNGTARILRQDISRHPAAVRAVIGVVFQSPSLDRKLTVEENLLHQGHLYGLQGSGLRARIRELLDRFGLADRARERVERLSGGLRRRLELAKGLLHRPPLLLLDEPSSALDPAARREFWSDLESLRASGGTTILLTTHLMEEADRCDRIAILNRGRVVTLGAPAALKEAIGGDVIRLESSDPERLCRQIQQRFGGNPVLLNGAVRVERPRGHEFIAQVVEAFPGEIQSVALSKPTLEDVFFHQTGQRFVDDSRTEQPFG